MQLIVPLLVLAALIGEAPIEEPGVAGPAITVVRHEPTAERIVFDPSNRPADMPPLDPGEAALCQFNFNCTVSLKYEVIERELAARHVEVTVHVRRIDVTLTLHNRIYLPRGTPPKVRAHEEGHRIINERVYAEAERVARAAALEVLTQSWRGLGDTPDAAAKAATDAAVKQLCDVYLAGTANKAFRVGEIYDQLTDHGRKARLSEADAIRRAFARYDAGEARSPAQDPTQR